MKEKEPIHFDLQPLPANHNEAVQWLLTLVKAADDNNLQQTSASEFRRGWYSIGFLYPGLHPDGALEHGSELSYETDVFPEISKIEARLLAPYYIESGWPVLASVAKEARRRYEADALEDKEFYCSEAVIAGICYRSPELADEVRKEREKLHAGLGHHLHKD
jgi:DNA (cytosine-5)-methyltransferase 1